MKKISGCYYMVSFCWWFFKLFLKYRKIDQSGYHFQFYKSGNIFRWIWIIFISLNLFLILVNFFFFLFFYYYHYRFINNSKHKPSADFFFKGKWLLFFIFYYLFIRTAFSFLSKCCIKDNDVTGETGGAWSLESIKLDVGQDYYCYYNYCYYY